MPASPRRWRRARISNACPSGECRLDGVAAGRKRRGEVPPDGCILELGRSTSRAITACECVAKSLPPSVQLSRASPGWPKAACWSGARVAFAGEQDHVVALERRLQPPTTRRTISVVQSPATPDESPDPVPEIEPSVTDAAPPRYTSRRPPAPGAEYSPGSMPISSAGAHPRSSGPAGHEGHLGHVAFRRATGEDGASHQGQKHWLRSSARCPRGRSCAAYLRLDRHRHVTARGNALHREGALGVGDRKRHVVADPSGSTCTCSFLRSRAATCSRR